VGNILGGIALQTVVLVVLDAFGIRGRRPLTYRAASLVLVLEALPVVAIFVDTSPLELLISVMLSAQTTDVNVNRVTEKLFVKYRRPEDYLKVPVAELERDIFATGFYRQKAKSLRGMMTMLIEEFDGDRAVSVQRATTLAAHQSLA